MIVYDIVGMKLHETNYFDVENVKTKLKMENIEAACAIINLISESTTAKTDSQQKRKKRGISIWLKPWLANPR